MSDLVDGLKARALDRRRRDVKMVGEANVGPLQGFFDWQVAVEIVRLRNELASTRKMLGELHAMVWGECPSLLNEDSGGNAKLDLEIRAALSLTS